MIDWTVELHRETGRAAPDRDALDVYLAALAAHHAAVSVTPQGRVSTRLTISAADAAGAVGVAIEAEEAAATTADLGGVVTAVVVADANTPDGEANWVRTPLLSLSEIGEMLGVSRQRASQLAHDHPQFPQQAASYSGRPLYEAAAIEAFADVWHRKTGRPAGKPAPLAE